MHVPKESTQTTPFTIMFDIFKCPLTSEPPNSSLTNIIGFPAVDVFRENFGQPKQTWQGIRDESTLHITSDPLVQQSVGEDGQDSYLCRKLGHGWIRAVSNSADEGNGDKTHKLSSDNLSYAPRTIYATTAKCLMFTKRQKLRL